MFQDSHLKKGTEAGKAYGIFGCQRLGTSQNLNLLSICYIPGSVLDAGDIEKDLKKKRKISRDFLGGPVVRTLHFHCRGQRVQFLFGQLRFYMLHGSTKKKKKKVCLLRESWSSAEERRHIPRWFAIECENPR